MVGAHCFPPWNEKSRKSEWNDELGHIDNVHFITIDEAFSEKIVKLDKSKQTVFICRSGGRSARAARLAQQLGFKKIFNMEGGMLAWKKESFPSITKNKAR